MTFSPNSSTSAKTLHGKNVNFTSFVYITKLPCLKNRQENIHWRVVGKRGKKSKEETKILKTLTLKST